MKTAIIFASPTPQRDTTEIGIPARGGKLYKLHIRVKLTSLDLSSALDSAKPRKGETVMNTFPVYQ